MKAYAIFEMVIRMRDYDCIARQVSSHSVWYSSNVESDQSVYFESIYQSQSIFAARNWCPNLGFEILLSSQVLSTVLPSQDFIGFSFPFSVTCSFLHFFITTVHCPSSLKGSAPIDSLVDIDLNLWLSSPYRCLIIQTASPKANKVGNQWIATCAIQRGPAVVTEMRSYVLDGISWCEHRSRHR